MFEFSFFVWNIHGMNGYGDYLTPSFVIDRILFEERDIVIITEFIRTKDWDEISSKLSSKYWRYTYDKKCGTNEILILVRKNFCGISDENLRKIPKYNFSANYGQPNFLQVIINMSIKLIYA